MKKGLTAILFLFLVASFIIFIFRDFPPISIISGLIQNIFSAPLAEFYKFKTNNISKDENQEIKKLKDEIKELNEKMVDYENLKMDNQALRAQFEEASILNKNLLPANIVGFSGSFFSPHTLIIDKGKKDGVKKDMVVVVSKYFVGKVDTVSEHFSKIILPTNTSFSTVGKIAESGILGIVKGVEDFILYDRILTSEKINKGDVIVTKGDVNTHGIGIPPGLIVGKISTINRIETKPFQNAKIESVIDYSKLNIVFVVKAH